MSTIAVIIFALATLLNPTNLSEFTITSDEKSVQWVQITDSSWDCTYLNGDINLGTWTISGYKVIVEHANNTDTIDLNEYSKIIKSIDFSTADSIISFDEYSFSTIYIKRKENTITVYQNDNSDIPEPIVIEYQ